MVCIIVMHWVDAEESCVYTNAVYQKISGLSFKQALGTVA